MSAAKTIAGAVALLLAALAVVSSRWRGEGRVERIVVRGAHLRTEQEILADGGVQPGARLAAIDLRRVRTQLQADPYVCSAIVRREPNALEYDIEERVPIARVVIDGAVSFLDSAGVIFPALPSVPLDLPLAYGATQPVGPVGPMGGEEIVDTGAVRDILAVLNAARAADCINDISAIRRLPSGTIRLETNSGAVPVYFGAPAEAGDKLAALSAFFPQLMQRGERNAAYIDVRFHDQVVVRWNDPLPIR